MHELHEKIVNHMDNENRKKRRAFLREAIGQLINELLDAPEINTDLEEINFEEEERWLDGLHALLSALDVHHHSAWKDRTPLAWQLAGPGKIMLTSFVIDNPRGRSVEELVNDLSVANLGLQDVTHYIEQIQRHLQFALDKSS